MGYVNVNSAFITYLLCTIQTMLPLKCIGFFSSSGHGEKLLIFITYGMNGLQSMQSFTDLKYIMKIKRNHRLMSSQSFQPNS